VEETARALAASGVPPREIRLPYVGRPARVANGVVVPGYAVPSSNITPVYSTPPAPSGIAYYGENDTSGNIEATTVEASSVVGTLTVNQLSTIYMDDLTPDMYGIQLNGVITNVTIQGTTGNEFWVQNTLTYLQQNDTMNFGDAVWNFSSSTVFGIPSGNSTILRHSPAGSVSDGIYIGMGPYISAPRPYTLTLYLNSSLTSQGDQECWFNYSLLASGHSQVSGTYDWVIFNSLSAHHPTNVPLATFEATGTHLNPGGLTNDYELEFGIGPFDGATVDVVSANLTATLGYCPATIPSCSPGQFRSVPAAEDFGDETGEASVGLSIAFNGTTAYAAAGPFVLRGLWGFSRALGSTAGFTPVTNAITVSGSPVPSSMAPYVFVFFNASTFIHPQFEWAPDVPVWYLPPGTYPYEVMLADYGEVDGTLTVGTVATSLSVTLEYHPASGVYTPLWAFGNAQLAGISSSGNGTISDQYRLFNNPTSNCTECGNARSGNLSPSFASYSGFLFPTFMGIWLVGTDAYVDIDHPVSLQVFSFTYGLASHPLEGPNFYLQIGLVLTHHVTLSNDTEAGGWPGMFELITLAGPLNASENPFPQANVMIWNSTNDLVMSNTFVPSWLVPPYQTQCIGVCPAVSCSWCVSPDGLLFYGGTNNTVWGNTFQDPTAPSYAPPETYAGLAEAESGDLIFNNNFSVDNPTVYLPFDIYNNSCPVGASGQCFPPLPPTYFDTWNVTAQPARDVAATVNGFPLSGNILGPTCREQGGNFWQDYGNVLNPLGVLPFVNTYDYSELSPALPSWWSANLSSIQLGGDFVPLTWTATCGSGVSTTPSSSSAGLSLVYAFAGVAVVAVVAVALALWIRASRKGVPAPWLAPPREGVPTESGVGPPTEPVAPLPSPTLRERWARRPPGLGFLVGVGILLVYVGAALSALVVFRNSLGTLSENLAWIPPYPAFGPSWAHPFGIMPGFGTDLFQAIWQATPWDLAIVAGILAIDVLLGFFLGAVAGLAEGGLADSAVTFVSDSLGTIPTFLLAIVVFAGLATAAPGSATLLVFVAVFGIILWPTMARTVRERARAVAHQPYIEAARSSGASFGRLLVRHIMPNSLAPVLAQIPLDVAPIFFVLSAFPWFYNCNLPGGPPHPPGSPPIPYLVPYLPPFSPLPSSAFPEWGYLLGFGTCEGFDAAGNFGNWWMYIFPLLVIVVLGIAIGLVCDGIERQRHFDR
jgi:thermopsin